MKTASKLIVVAFGLLTAGSFAFAQETGSGSQQLQAPREEFARFYRWHRHRTQLSFRLGICVGEALAQKSISLPVPQAGKRVPLDSATAAALKSAVDQCRSDFAAPAGSSPTTPGTTPSAPSAPPSVPVLTPPPTGASGASGSSGASTG